MTQTQNDVVTVLIDDHRAVERVFQELEGGQGSPEHRRAPQLSLVPRVHTPASSR